MWFGGDFKNYGLTQIRAYVDDEKQPSVDMELIWSQGPADTVYTAYVWVYQW
jgi:hypothetical protein